MKILFRADANAYVGAGHVMRCLSIADAARDKGIECTFVTAGDAFEEIITIRGYRDIVLGTDYKNMNSELPQMTRIIEVEHPAAVFVDSYFVTHEYLKELRHVVNLLGNVSPAVTDGTITDTNSIIPTDHIGYVKLIYIDDVLAFPYPCDILLNYNIYADEEEYRNLYKDTVVPELLLGTLYAPLRKEFTGADEKRYNCDRPGHKIFISTGGADFEHLMPELIREIKRRDTEYVFHLVIGSANEDKNIIFAESSGEDRIVLHENVTDMAELMLSCDVAISAAGSTLYELCACRIPAVTYILADNQIPGARGFEQLGIMECAGDIREVGAKVLAERLIDKALQLCVHEHGRNLISERLGSVVDGCGAKRIVKSVFSEAI